MDLVKPRPLIGSGKLIAVYGYPKPDKNRNDAKRMAEMGYEMVLTH